MSAFSEFVDCANVQAGIAEVFFGNTNMKAYTKANITKFLLSGTNTDNVMKNIIASNGKLRTVEVVYGQRYTIDEVGDSGIVTCATGAVQGETSKTYTIDPKEGSNIAFFVPMGELRRRCEADVNYLNKEILKAMQGLIAGVEKKTADKMVLNLGNFASDVDAGNPAGTSTYKEGLGWYTDGAIRYGAYEAVTFENMANDFDMAPVVFGSEAWFKYAKAIGAACCGDNGVDAGLYASQNPYLFAYSREIATALAEPTAAVSVIPGAAQLIWANEFENDLLRINNGGQLTQSTILYPDADLPLAFDYRAELTCDAEGNKGWKVELALSHDVVFMPDDMFKAGDRLEGVNGINQFRICGNSGTCEVG